MQRPEAPAGGCQPISLLGLVRYRHLHTPGRELGSAGAAGLKADSSYGTSGGLLELPDRSITNSPKWPTTLLFSKTLMKLEINQNADQRF